MTELMPRGTQMEVTWPFSGAEVEVSEHALLHLPHLHI